MKTRATIALDGDITIYRAVELHRRLQLALSQPGTRLDMDLSAVTDLDSAGVQLLMAAKRAAEATGGSLVLSGHSPAVVDVFEMMNLAGFFGDPIVMGSQTTHEEHAR